MYGGVVAGLLSTVLSAVATAYFFMLPELSLRLVSELKGANARIRLFFTPFS